MRENVQALGSWLAVGDVCCIILVEDIDFLYPTATTSSRQAPQ